MIARRSRRHAASSYSLGTLMERESVLSLLDCSVDLYSDDLLTVLNSMLYHISNASTVECMMAHKALHDRGTQTVN